MQSVLCHTLLDVLFAFADPLVFTSLPTLYISSSVTIHAAWAHPALVADGTNIATRHVVLGAHVQVLVKPHIKPDFCVFDNRDILSGNGHKIKTRHGAICS